MTLIQTRVDKIRSFMLQNRLDGVLLRNRRSFSWMTCGKTNYIVNTTEAGVADLLIFAEKMYCITTKMEFARIEQEELSGLGFEFVTPEWYEGHDKAIIDLCHGKKMGSDVSPETTGLTTAIDVSRALAELSYVLGPEEIERYRWLSKTSAQALESTCREIEPGMSEFEIQAHLASKVMKLGINPQVILVATDDRVFKYRHPIPTDRQLSSYAMIVICGEKWGLVTNVTRFVHFGLLPNELRENKQKLVEIDLAMNLATRPGVPIKDVFRIGIETYRKVGHGDDWRYLHQGGPTGYASREFLATPDCGGTVQLHQAFTWNPAIKGIKSEDTILVGNTENEFLTDTGEWEYIAIEQDGRTYKRPDILIR